MGFNCGIVGLPERREVTLFNALTMASVGAENFPFCTIEPNSGIVPMPDPRLDRLAQHRFTGKGDSHHHGICRYRGPGERRVQRGDGLGNQFLANIRETDAIAHVVRCFEDENVVHVDHRIDPATDIEVVNTELEHWRPAKPSKKPLTTSRGLRRSGDKAELARLQYLERLQAHIDEGRAARTFETTSDFADVLRDLHLLTIKPVLYIANVDEDGFEDNPLLDAVREIAASEKAEVVAICNKLEAEIVELDAGERAGFLADLGMEEPGLDRVVRAGYRLLGLQTYFTAGPKEARAWTVRAGASAPQAAGVIHTDFEKGFIRAEVISYQDYIEYGGENGAREAGRRRLEGKDYVVRDGDVIHFRFNV